MLLRSKREFREEESTSKKKPTPPLISGADSRYTGKGKSERIWWQGPIVLNVKKAGSLLLTVEGALGKL